MARAAYPPWMRFAQVAILALASAPLACGAGATLNQSNGAKMGEALAFASVAAAAQIVQSAAEQRARNNAPIAHSSTGVSVNPQCDNEGQYPCVSVSAASSRTEPAPMHPDSDMSEDEARDYVLGYVNGVRKLNAVAPVARDESLDAFAQAGSEQLAQDHRPNQHMALHGSELHAKSGEVQGSPDGAPPGVLEDRIAEILLRMMAEGKGGMHYDAILQPEWRRLGVGLVSHGGRMYVTVDFASE